MWFLLLSRIIMWVPYTLWAHFFVGHVVFGGSTSAGIRDLTTIEIQALFELFDVDGDGRISKDDFSTCLRRNPLLIAHFNHLFMHKDLDAERGLDEMV
ncbi:putative plasmalogen synthase [Helianthus debilis subsp. tardiflorus]